MIAMGFFGPPWWPWLLVPVEIAIPALFFFGVRKRWW